MKPGHRSYAHEFAASLRCAVHITRLAREIESARKHALALQTDLHATLHRGPHIEKIGMNLVVLALIDVVVQFVACLAAPAHDRLHRGVFVHWVEGLAVGTFDFAQLGIGNDRSTSNRVVRFLTDFLVVLKGFEGHTVHMECQCLIGFPDERDLFGLQLVLNGHIGHVSLSRRSQRTI